LAGSCVIAAAPIAHADPPTGWDKVDEGGKATVSWRLEGRIEGRPGNWRTGWLNVDWEYLDDSAVGFVADWWCPPGARPSQDPTKPTSCSLRRYVTIADHDTTRTFAGAAQNYVAEFDHSADTLSVSGIVEGRRGVDGQGARVQLPIDVTLEAVGEPRIDRQRYDVPGGRQLDYREVWVDGSTLDGRLAGVPVGSADVKQFRTGLWYAFIGFRAS